MIEYSVLLCSTVQKQFQSLQKCMYKHSYLCLSFLHIKSDSKHPDICFLSNTGSWVSGSNLFTHNVYLTKILK